MSKRTRRRLAAGIKRGQLKNAGNHPTPWEAQGFLAPLKAGTLTVLDGVPEPDRRDGGITDPQRSAFIQAWLRELQGELGEWAPHFDDAPEVDLEAACRQASLTAKQIEATLMYLELRSLQRVAHLLGVSIRAVRDRLGWARRKLRAFFDKTPLDNLVELTA